MKTTWLKQARRGAACHAFSIENIEHPDDPAEIMCLLCNTFFVPHSGTVFLTLQRRRNAHRLGSRGWAKRFIPIYFEPGGPLGILPAAFSKATDTTKGPP